MLHTRASRVVATILLVAGACTWTLLTASTPEVNAAFVALFDDARYDSVVDPGDGEMQMALFDARTAALLVMAGGVAAFAAPRVRSGRDAVCVVGASVGVLLPAGALLTWLGDSSMAAAAACGAVLLAAALAVLTWSRRWLAATTVDGNGASAALLVGTALMLVASLPALAQVLPERAWVRASLPTEFMVGYATVEVLLVLAPLALVVLTLPRAGVTPVTAAGMVAATGAWLVAGLAVPPDSVWALVAVGVGLVGGTTLLAVSGLRNADGAAPTVMRQLASIVGAGLGYALMILPGYLAGLPLGLMLLSMSGQELGADGMPLLLGSTMAGLVGLCFYRLAMLASEGRSLPLAHAQRIASACQSTSARRAT